MKKKVQVVLNDEAAELVDLLIKGANENFDSGSITYSDLLNEMILNSKVDIKTLQAKHADLRKFLRSLASKPDIDLEQVYKTLGELKTRTQKRKTAGSTEEAS